MITRQPAEIGMSLEEVDTPALLLDLDALERNLNRMSEDVARTAVHLRPHAKTHKCPIIALRQIALGAVGVCSQKVSEAESLIYGGVQDVLITNQIVGRIKLARLAALANQTQVSVCADDPENVRDLNKVSLAFGLRLSVLVEVNLGMDRCGVELGQPALTLAKQIADSPGLRFAGLQAYHGSAQHIREYEKRREIILGAAERLSETVGLLRRNGLTCDLVTGGGTGTYLFEIESQVFNEIQPGSYVFMDADYGRNLRKDGTPSRDFEHALFVYTTVISRPVKERAVVDAGLKAVSVDSGMPLAYERPDVEFIRASDEHGKLVFHDPNRALRVGDKIRLVPGHCDPTVNLFDWYVGVRSNRVEAVWPVTGRGATL